MENKNDFLIGMLIGAAVGAGVALLYAPQPGVETRELVGRKAGEVVQHGREMVNHVRQEGESLVEDAESRGRDVMEHAAQEAEGLAEDTMKAAERTQERTQL
jgi:gas vesicle protein